MTKRACPRSRAFSLLESLVVMLVIILLASIVIPGFLERGREKEELPLPKLPDPKEQIAPGVNPEPEKEPGADE